MDKTWDHPWSTEEMRNTRREWSLAGDAGLLKHLQQFSETLASRANKTQESLDSLTTQLNETSILIDNVTNTSLALANTQFIESRVQEDEIDVQTEVIGAEKDEKDQDLVTANVIASVSESVRQGLNIMDKKYQRMEVVDSDSEDDEDAKVLSVILGPNDPYQDRPLPYVIGTDKWKASNKIGLESSSSESEQLDEEDEESEGENDDKMERLCDTKTAPKINIARLSSSSSESENYNEHSNNITYMNNGKLDGISQATINSSSESVTPIYNLPKVNVSNKTTPNFAEELAKRLGNVTQIQNPVLDEAKEPSINRLKDDLFEPEQNEDLFGNKSDNYSTGSKDLFDDQSSTNLWKGEPRKSYEPNIIPPSIDVPPPISTISTKPKSAIDDLFADADSEDSDDIFSSKSSIKKITKQDESNKKQTTVDDVQKKYLDIIAPATASNIITSTPEINVTSSKLFSDEEEDDIDLFGATKSRSSKVETLPSAAPDTNKKKPIGGVSILGSISTSDIQNKLSSRIVRRQSSSSSSSDTSGNNDSVPNNESARRDNSRASVNNGPNERSFIIGNLGAENLAASMENSSGISIQPPSINNTMESSVGLDFQPSMTSTRLRSEEIYRERMASDSLFAEQTRNPNRLSSSNMMNNRVHEEQQEVAGAAEQDDVFENEDLFGPPPLPKADTKPAKSKVSSLFDDSDSGDELFSTTSSGSRSQKSTDFVATTPQYADKSKNAHRRGLFDEDINIFINRDAPDVDIFGAVAKPPRGKEESHPAVSSGNTVTGVSGASVSSKESTLERAQVAKLPPKKDALFDDEEDDVLFGSGSIKSEPKAKSIFDDEKDTDLFSTKNVSKKEEKPSAEKAKTSVSPKRETSSTKSSGAVRSRKTSGRDSGELVKPSSPENGLFSNTTNTRGLFEDDDYDDLFGTKKESGVESKVETKTKTDIKPIESETKADVRVVPKSDDRGDEKSVPASDTSIAQTEATSDVGEPLQGNAEEGVRKRPPKTLNIRSNVSSSVDESAQAPRRAVSGKIKDLMGKMGDLKILSPTDTPPLWRRSEEKTDEEDDAVDRDSDDGGRLSTQGHNSTANIRDLANEKQSPPSTTAAGSNVEVPVSFDEPLQVETLSTAASKSRVRIQAKRRPQSRHARKSALRQSGIDFDTVDTGEDLQEENHAADLSASSNKEFSDATSSNRLNVAADSLPRTIDDNVLLTADDRSDIGSLSKENSMSANKNTLLSPSTDEEDLFDVPPDLPEDPQKEDTLFGRAPLLSPVENVRREKSSDVTLLRDTIIGRNAKDEENVRTLTGKPTIIANSPEITESDEVGKAIESRIEERRSSEKKHEWSAKAVAADKAEKDAVGEKLVEEPIDPLRDISHDPLKDPSQLFAFVTKTPSPEKGKSLLFPEDDSLFSSGPKKSDGLSAKKQVLDLFDDDSAGDLFSKPIMKPLKDTKISLFDDDAQNDESDSLFGSVSKKLPRKTEKSEQPRVVSAAAKKVNIFEDDDEDTNLFAEVEAPKKVPEQKSQSAKEPAKASRLKDIFGDQSSGEDDIFAAKKIIPKKMISSKSLFASDDKDDGQIFAAPSSSESRLTTSESRPVAKKTVTRDLKKTAEKIAEDPLSLLQDD